MVDLDSPWSATIDRGHMTFIFFCFMECLWKCKQLTKTSFVVVNVLKAIYIVCISDHCVHSVINLLELPTTQMISDCSINITLS